MKKTEYTLFTSEKHIGKSNNISIERKTIKGICGMHWHDFFEIEVIADGSGTQILNGNEYPLKRGCVYILSPLDFHDVSAETETEVFNIMFSEDILPKELLYTFINKKKDNIFYLEDDEFEEIISMCRLFENEYKKNREYKNTFLKNILECFLITILRKTNIKDEVKKGTDYIQNGIIYMQMHFKENPTLTETAHHLNLNPNYFSQKFKESVGKSYIEYLTELKLSYAERLLLSGSFNITEACYLSGFNSISNFLRVFKNRYGASPSLYIKNKAAVTN